MTVFLPAMRHFLLLFLCLCLPLSAAEKLRVLMIGNSYTAQTRTQVKGFLDADPEVDAELVAHCPGGRKLVQHLANPKVDALLRDEKGWDVVVLQEQSQVPAFAMTSGGGELKMFVEGGEGMLRKIRTLQPKARILLFETWARHGGPEGAGVLKAFGGDPRKMQKALSKGYALLRKNPGKWDFSATVTIAPVGTAWEAWYRQHGYKESSRSLHSKDGSHPGKLGAYLTGAVFYEALTGRSAVEVEYAGRVGDADLAAELRAQAHEVF